MSSLAQRFSQADPAVLWLLAGILCILAPHFYYQPSFLILIVCGILLWRLYIELKYFKPPPSWLSTLLAVTTFLGISYGYQTIFGRDAGVALLIAMMCLKLLEMGTRRDFMVAVFLGYFVVITGFLFDQSVIIGLTMTTAVFLLTTALISYHRSRRTLTNQYKSAKLGINLLFQAVPLTIILFVLFPRVHGPLWGLPEQGNSASTGLSNSMAPGQITELAFDNSVAFRVKFDGEVPPSDKLYWRGPVFTYYDGFMWQELSRSSRKFFGGQWTNKLPPVPQVKFAEGINYSVMLEPHNANWLLALDLPTIYPPDSFLSTNYELMSEEPVKKIKSYKLTSHLNYTLSAEAPPTNRVYQQIPKFVGPRARELISDFQDKIVDSKPYGAQMVNLVLNYFREQPFFYTRTPPPMLDKPIDQFLFDARRGFCEHYSSAFVVLMRAAGIPARVVTGYQGGELNTIGNYFIVRQSDAHAWAEVWLADKGWVRFDPTSVIPPNRVEQAQFRNRFEQSAKTGEATNNWFSEQLKHFDFLIDNINHSWNDWIVGYSPKKQRSLFDSFGLKNISANKVVVLLFGLLTVFIVIIAIHLSRHTIRKPSPAQLMFKKFCRKLAKKGFKYSPAETARSFADRVVKNRADLKQQVIEITDLYNQLRYTQAPAESSLRMLEQRVNQFKP